MPRTLWRGLLVLYFVAAISFLLVRYVAMPQVGMHRDDIADALSRALGLRVQISELQAEWTGLRPEIHIRGLRIFDRADRPALELPSVDATLAWSSLWRQQIVTQRLTLSGTHLAIRREADGGIFVAGLQVNANDSKGGDGFSRFVLGQERIDIRDASLSWRDMQRAAPQLELDDVNLRLINSGARHRVALRAAPPAAMAAPLDIRADLRGRSFADLSGWRGAVYVGLDRADLAVWSQWIDYPVDLPAGKGGVHAWVNFEGNKVAGLTADVALRDVTLRAQPDLPELHLSELSGRLRGAVRAGDMSFSADRLQLATADGIRMAPARLALRTVGATDAHPQRVEASAANIDLDTLHHLSTYIPIPDAERISLEEASPTGHVTELSFNWQGPGADAAAQPMRFTAKAKFDNVSVRPRGAIPGVEGLSGAIDGNERSGTYDVTIRGGLHLPAEMQTPFLPLERATLRGGWSHRDVKGADTLAVQVREGHIVNPDAAGTVSGEWLATGHSGSIDLTGRFTHAKAAAVWRYMPISVPTTVTDWLRGHLISGEVRDISLRLAGELDRFPYRNDPKQGVFTVQGHIADARIEFAPGWPGLQGVRGSLLFDRTRMLIQADTGRYGAARVSGVKVEIPDLEDVGKQVLTVDGRAAGPTKDFLDYVANSHLADLSGHFSRQTTAVGNGELDLHLAMPLHDGAHTQVKGTYRFINNQIKLFPSLPEFRNTNARLAFTEHGLSMPELSAEFIGSPLRARGETDSDGTLRFDGTSTVPVEALRQLADTDMLQYLSGSFDARVGVTIRKGLAEVAVTSSLIGVKSNLPAPLGKGASEPLPSTLTWRNAGIGDTAPAGGDGQSWRFKIGNRGEVMWEEACTPAGGCRMSRGAVAVGDSASLPERGIRLSGRFQRLDVDAWKPIVLAASTEGPSAGAELAAGAVVQADELVAAGHVFRKVTGRVLRQGGDYVVRLEGPDIAGDITWQGAGQGRMLAHFSRLALQPVKGDAPAASGMVEQKSLPAFDIVADDFSVQGMALGRLQLRANNAGDEWRLEHLSVDSADNHLNGSGVWRPFGARRVMMMAFTLESEDAGKLLARLGYPDSMRGGRTEVKGSVSWRGSPGGIDFPTLNGTLDLEVDKGQFNKLNPGAGRLLGILSLQSLPRRLTLDFRDVFSEGFAFDTLGGTLAIKNGVMSTDDLEMRGPAARVRLVGNTDLSRERHDLRVMVQPTLSETVAVGAAAVTGIINPVVGLATYLAQKALRDPVEKIFSFEYTVTGSWSDPKVERVLAIEPRDETSSPLAKP
ncbi:YhdP family protein [Uliginosibacterium sp. sgz301328]|uniref:YhdP family protein n=1 Tax=Uliginosibacterium sp. sgz301328 TaxID=3243764 RepID=UPI00359D2F70